MSDDKKKWRVSGTMRFDFDIEVEADDEESAREEVDGMAYSQLLDHAMGEELELDDCWEVT